MKSKKERGERKRYVGVFAEAGYRRDKRKVGRKWVTRRCDKDIPTKRLDGG